MPHYAMRSDTPEMEFEAQGFIRSSFAEGLSPREFFFHTATGREGVTDSAMATANSGYAQRRLVKTLEDVVIAHDGTVRDGTGNVLSYVYGYNGFNPARARTVHVDGRQAQRLADAASILRIIHGNLLRELTTGPILGKRGR